MRTTVPFFIKKKKVYGMYDVPHLIKSVRNNLLRSNLQTLDGVVSWKIIEYIYNTERNNTTKMCPKLKYAHRISRNECETSGTST